MLTKFDNNYMWKCLVNKYIKHQYENAFRVTVNTFASERLDFEEK